jgi:hypothetical protein
MRMSYDGLLEMESEFDQRGSHDAANVHMLGIADKFKQSAQGRLLSPHREFSREQYALLILNWLLRAEYHSFWKRMLRLIGVGAGVGQEWIAVTSAAATGGHRLTLLHSLKAAGAHSGSGVLPAILVLRRRRRRRHRYIGQRQERRGGRGGQFQNLFHLVLPVLGSTRNPTWDCSRACAIESNK